MENGTIKFVGEIEETISLYISEGSKASTIYGKNLQNDMHFKKVSIVNKQGIATDSIAYNEKVRIEFEIGVKEYIPNATLSFTLFDSKLNAITTSHVELKNSSRIISAHIPENLLLTGNYFIKPILHIPNVKFLDNNDELISFSVIDTGSVHSIYNRPDLGIINLNTNWIQQ